MTITFTDEKVGSKYEATDVKLVTYDKEYSATSIQTTVQNGIATVTLIFPHIIQFSNPKVKLRINDKKVSFKVCL